MTAKPMMDLKRRLCVSTISGAVVASLIFFSTYRFISFLLVLFVALLAGVGIWEYSRLAISKKLHPKSHLMIISAVAVVASLFISLEFDSFNQLPLIVIASSMALFFLFHFKNTSNSLVTIAVEFFGIAYIAVPLSLMLGILYPISYGGIPQEGRWWLVYLIMVTKITDIGAYFVGRLWGKHKLSPLLSPKKTIEGSIAGFICAILMSMSFYYLGDYFLSGNMRFSFIESLWLGALIGIFGQVGDLAESLLKRDADVKDSNIIPGLGGILDMVDSLLFTIPILYFFIRMH